MKRIQASAKGRTGVRVALSSTGMCAVIGSAGGNSTRLFTRALQPPDSEGVAGWPELTNALHALAAETGSGNRTLTITLLPSLAEVRTVQVPPLGDEALHQLLVRNPGKYFLSARGPQVAGAVRAGTEKSSRVVAAANARLLNTIHSSAGSAGFGIDAILPAESAWAAAAMHFAGRTGKPVHLLVARTEHTVLLSIDNAHSDRSRLTQVRRFRAGAADAEHIAAAHATHGGALLLVGEMPQRAELSAALSVHGLHSHTPATDAELLKSPEALAATFVHADLEPALRTESVRESQRVRVRSLVMRTCAAAALLLVISAVLQLWGVKRELAAVRAERDALKPLLSATLVGRSTVETTFRQLAALAATDRNAPQWSHVLSGISEELPLESYLTGFRGRADTVGIDGLAMRAARVFDAVERVPQLSGVHASAPVRRETSPDGQALERFQITALRKPSPADSTGSQR